jgi:uncharacterized radical SAM superfamily protein
MINTPAICPHCGRDFSAFTSPTPTPTPEKINFVHDEESANLVHTDWCCAKPKQDEWEKRFDEEFTKPGVDAITGAPTTLVEIDPATIKSFIKSVREEAVASNTKKWMWEVEMIENGERTAEDLANEMSDFLCDEEI